MIVYEFKCICDCQFDGWFASRSDFERQHDDGLIICPQCGSDQVHKILSPVAIHSGLASPVEPDSHQQSPEGSKETMTELLRAVQDFVEKNFEDVGAKLAEESLKIHYGVNEPRNIRGFATSDQEKILRDEGIELLKIPFVKKDPGPKMN